VKTGTPASGWGRKAEALYQPSYAREYRRHDEELDTVAAYEMFCSWLRDVSLSFGRPIDVLDLGCGTGRYFCAVSNARTLVGLDASAAMLNEARHPVNAERITAGAIDLVRGDVMEHDFGPARFDLVYSIGVLAEHTPLDSQVVANVGRWTKPGGRFAFTTVHPDSPSVTQTWTRSVARRVLPLTRGQLRRRIHDRLTIRGLYADETRIREVLAPAFTIESLTRVRSEAHLHGLCVARRNDA
jgi:ubiquinone/menaquinone biosynthesis C-methylase UbiE